MHQSEILVRNAPSTGWYVGDVVAIKPSGFKWGSHETGSNFLIIKSTKTVVDLSRCVQIWIDHQTRKLMAKSMWRYQDGLLINKKTGEKVPVWASSF